MKESQVIIITLLLFCIVLIIRGEEIQHINPRRSTNQDLTNQEVNKIIQAEDGDVYDCIDINRQPAFNHPLLKDHKIQLKPNSFPVGIDVENPFMYPISEAQLPTAECPTGTIPILCNNRQENISTKSTDAIGTSQQQEVAGIKYFDDIYGTQAAINIYEPMVKHHWDLSGSWIQIENGPDVIGAGSWVSPSFSGDSFARFHISWDPKTENWWLVYGEEKTAIGYWPSSQFSYMKEMASKALWGGYVQGPTASEDSPQMGSGHFASEGYGKAAFVRDIQVVNEDNMRVIPNPVKADPGSTNRRKYTYEYYGHNPNGMHVYYGGPGSYS
uniref:Neprosin PEP catalytic domain-containing protein n=1 Tax=Oryza nivara TaxID=4536 RepID=A0A0E0HNS7_ORYNI